MKNSERYITFVKLVDPSMYYKKTNDEKPEGFRGQQANTDLTNGCVSITFLAKDKEMLPKIKKVGDIIRVHRCNIGQYRNFKTFYANIDFGSSWALFRGAGETPEQEEMQEKESHHSLNIKNYFLGVEEEQKQPDSQEDPCQIKPFVTSKKEYTVNSTDTLKVQELRDWQRKIFKSDLIYDTVYNLNKLRETISRDQKAQPDYEREFDLVVKVEELDRETIS
jgi:hypothetical protein